MIDRLVILAAGGGTRLRSKENDLPKPLHKVGGVSLCVRVIAGAQSIGVKTVDIILGYRGEEIRQALLQTLHVDDLELRFWENPSWASTSNGVSLLAASQDTRPFYLSMSDHLFDNALWECVKKTPLVEEGVTLLIDRDITRCFDLEDATKVKTEGRLITAIDKNLTDYNALDCGLFVASAAIFAALAIEQKQTGDCSLSSGMKRLAHRGKFEGQDIGSALWHDVDTPEAFLFANKLVKENPLAFDTP